MTFTATAALNNAMLVGGIAATLDADPVSPAYALLFAGTKSLVTIMFARPAATLTANKLRLSQASASGDLITEQGSADNFMLYNGAGVLLGSGDVTASGGAGALTIGGTAGTMLYAGARAILGELTFG